MKSRFKTTFLAAVALLAAAPASLAAGGSDGPFCAGEESWLVRSGTEEFGDRYVFANSISMDGIQNGDLLGFTPKLSIDGEVRGDLFAFANSVDISGTIRDSTRLFAQNLDVDGTIEGDLVVFAAVLNLKDTAHITGSVYGSAAHFNLLGRVDGDVRLTSGESTIDGIVGGDLKLKADTINFGDAAKVEGDLIYTSRTELPANVADHVAGEVVHNTIKDDDEKDDDEGITLGSILWWFYWPLAAFVAGALLLALAGRHRSVPVERIDEEGWIGLAIGLFAMPVLAVASVVGLVLLPLGIGGLLLLGALAFVGKLPAALWLGRRMLGLAGRSAPSPYGSLALGLLAVYLLFAIPYIGWAIWYVTTSAGIGSLILGAVALRRESESERVEA